MKLTAVIFSLSCGVVLNAGLVWPHPEREIVARHDREKVSVAFRYRNEGSKPFTIERVRDSCGCVDIKGGVGTVVRPGATGKLVVGMKVRGTFGMRLVRILVEGREEGKDEFEKYHLMLRVNIERVVSANPAFLRWRIGEERTPKTVEIDIEKGKKVSLKRVAVKNPAFQIEEEKLAGNKFSVKVTPPPDKNKTCATLLTAYLDYPGGERELYIYLNCFAPPERAPGGKRRRIKAENYKGYDGDDGDDDGAADSVKADSDG